MTTRREFLKLSTLAGAGLLLPFGAGLRRAFADTELPLIELFPQPVLDPASIPKYVAPLPNPLTPSFILTPDTAIHPGFDFYRISQQQISWQVLPTVFPKTKVWAYGDPTKPGTFSYPGHTIVARSGRPVKVKYKNQLPLTHLLPVDTTLHGAEPPLPEVRTVTHLHGGKNVRPESDGYPEAWVTPDGKTIEDFGVQPSIYTPFNPDPFVYPNDQEAAQLWFHDHALGVTRLNVYAGLAAFYTLRDENEDYLVATGQLPTFPYEVPIVIQDRMFYPDGSWAYPDAALGDPPVQPSIVPEFFGEVIVVNGRTWPFLKVEPRKYRIRFLNGSEARFYTLRLSSGQPFYVIGMEGGFLNEPVAVTELIISPAERFDCIIDFAGHQGEIITLTNSAPTPFPDGDPVVPGSPASEIMQFRVISQLSGRPDTVLPTNLRPLLGPVPTLMPTVTRQVLLFEGTDEFGRLRPQLGTITAGALRWDVDIDPITENPAAGTTEVWEIYNTTPDAHPIHIHEVLFRIVDRQEFTADQDPNTGALTNVQLVGAPQPPPDYEQGLKDTVIAYPGMVTRVAVEFEMPGLFVWHCHILNHEDHEMMRPYHIGPIPTSP